MTPPVPPPQLSPKPLLPEVEDEDDDDDSEDALNEFDFLGSGENGAGRRAGEGVELGEQGPEGGAVDLGDPPCSPPPPNFGARPPDPRVPAESHRGRLRGMLADLRDVDGLPPKPATAGPPRPHEGTVLGVSVSPGGGEGHCPQGHPQPLPSAGSLGISSDVFIMDSIGGGAVSLGDLADLTVTNDNELSCDVSHPPHVPTVSPNLP